MAAQLDPKWTRSVYWLRKKGMSLKNTFWLEDGNEQRIGVTNRKALAIKDEIQLLGPEKGDPILFRLREEKGMDVTLSYAVTDVATNEHLGVVRRRFLKSELGGDEWELLDPSGAPFGRVYEGTGAGLVREHVPTAGLLIKMKMTVEVYGQPVGVINKLKRGSGERWVLDCKLAPKEIDRRVLISALLLMALVEQYRS